MTKSSPSTSYQHLNPAHTAGYLQRPPSVKSALSSLERGRRPEPKRISQRVTTSPLYTETQAYPEQSPVITSPPNSPSTLSMDSVDRMIPVYTTGTSDTPSRKRLNTSTTKKPSKRQRASGIEMVTIPGESFPTFKSGEVVILTKLGEEVQRYQLHKTILERSSSWFRDAFLAANSTGLGRSAYFFMLDEKLTDPMLVQRSADQISLRIDVPADIPEVETASQTNVKTEKLDDDTSCIISTPKTEEATRARSATPTHTDIIQAYKSLFRCMYNSAPQISGTNVKRALGQSEILVKLAKEYGSLEFVRPHLGNLLSQFRQTLFVSIKTDPPRWIRLGVDLESPSIYTEALIHIVGTHPVWPWTTTHKSEVDPSIHKLIRSKAQHLAKLSATVERDLFLNDIQGPDGRSIRLESDFESWLPVQLFRDWFCHEVRSCNYRNSDEQSPMKSGTLYRKIRKGGEAYLAYDHVLTTLSSRVRDKSNSWEDLAADLKMLKEYASKTVEDITKNNLMLDVEANLVGYLTCVDVTPADYPWALAAEE